MEEIILILQGAPCVGRTYRIEGNDFQSTECLANAAWSSMLIVELQA